MPTDLERAARAASKRMKSKPSSLGERDDGFVKSSMKKRPRKKSKRERSEGFESPRGRTHDN